MLLRRDDALEDVAALLLIVVGKGVHKLGCLLNELEVFVEYLLGRVGTIDEFGKVYEVRLLPDEAFFPADISTFKELSGERLTVIL
mgnify:CR=1 FL=1